MSERKNAVKSGISFEHPAGFWGGSIAISIGVLIHVKGYIESGDMNYVLSEMPRDATMIFGMLLIVAGIAGTVWGLVPSRDVNASQAAAHLKVRALDDAKINKSHVTMLLVMAFAVTIDVMKPITLGFVLPGMTEEYGLKSPLNPTGGFPAAWFPFSALSGLVIGSFVWGWLGDRIGRRASILLSAVLFIATSICGAMPAVGWNMAMCFIMGLGVGGMLPIAFALMSETIPARHRGWLMVLIGGDVAGAFILTSALSAWLVPDFTWRIMWLIGMPTGILMILLNRWIPESPRFLLAHNRKDEAKGVMEKYGATVVEVEHSELEVESGLKGKWAQLFETPFFGLSTVVLLFALGCGLVSFGFQLWIPTNLQKLGFDQVTSSTVLRDSALIGFPATFVVAWLYGFWSSKKVLVILGLLTGLSLFGFVLAGDSVVSNRPLLYVLLVIPITGISSILAVVLTYASEIYPTRIRSRGTGMVAGASKVGGLFILAIVIAGIAPPSIAITALIGGLPMVIAGLAIIKYGVETRKRRLEDITADELHKRVEVPDIETADRT